MAARPVCPGCNCARACTRAIAPEAPIGCPRASPPPWPVQCRQRHPQSLGKDQRLGGKGIVQLQNLQRCGLEAVPLQKLQRRALGCQHGGFRGSAHTHRPQPVRTRLQLPALAGRRTGQQQQGRPIGFGRNGHGAQAAILASGTAPRAQLAACARPAPGSGRGGRHRAPSPPAHHPPRHPPALRPGRARGGRVPPRPPAPRGPAIAHRQWPLRHPGMFPVAPRRGKGGALKRVLPLLRHGVGGAGEWGRGSRPRPHPAMTISACPSASQGTGVGDGVQPASTGCRR